MHLNQVFNQALSPTSYHFGWNIKGKIKHQELVDAAAACKSNLPPTPMFTH